MRRALILALLILVAAACDSNYDPPTAYGVGPGYGSNGIAYAAQQSPSVFVFEEVVEEPEVVDSDAAPAIDIPSNLSDVVAGCIEDNGQPYAPWCLCLEEKNRGEAEDLECRCLHIVCTDNSPNEDEQLSLTEACVAYLTGQGLLDALLGPCAPQQ